MINYHKKSKILLLQMNLLTRIILEGGKLLFIPTVNATHYYIKSLRYNCPVIWNNFFPNANNNLCDTGISEFKNYSKDPLIDQYNITLYKIVKYAACKLYKMQNTLVSIHSNCYLIF